MSLKSLFCRPTAASLARRELAEAQRWLLHWQSAQEHATAMAVMNLQRVARLQAYLEQHDRGNVHALPVATQEAA